MPSSSSSSPPSACRNPSNLPQSCRVISRWSQLHSANTAKGDASMKMMEDTAVKGSGEGDEMKDDGEDEEKKSPATTSALSASAPSQASPEYDQFLPHSSMIICSCTACCPCEMHTRLRKSHVRYQHLLQQRQEKQHNEGPAAASSLTHKNKSNSKPKKRKRNEAAGGNDDGAAIEANEEKIADGAEEKTAPSPLKKQKKNNKRKSATISAASSSSISSSTPPSSTTTDLLCVKSYSDLHSRFDLFSQIGSGTFSCVFQARMREDCIENKEILSKHPTGVVAVKRFLISSHPHRLYTEQEFLQRYGCMQKHILPMLGMHQVIGAPSVLILPYFEHQDFRSHYTRLSLHTVQTYLRGLLTSIAYLAENKIMHRDIKPDNFLFNFERAKKEEQEEVERRKMEDVKMKEEAVETSDSSATAAASSSTSSLPPIIATTGIPSSLNGFLVDFGLSHTELQVRPELLLERKKKQQQQQEMAVDLLAMPEQRTAWKQQEESKSLEQQQVEMKAEEEQEEEEHKSTATATKSSKQKNNTQKTNKKKPTPTQDQSTARCAGTRGYRAPEILASCVTQTCAIDVWSVGSILAAMLTWKYPFFSGDEEVGLAEVMHVCGDTITKERDESGKLIEQVRIWEQLITFERAEKEKEFVWEEYSRFSTSLHFPPEFFSLLRGLLTIDPQRRLTAAQALEHPLFQKDYVGVNIESTAVDGTVKDEKRKVQRQENGERKESGVKSEK